MTIFINGRFTTQPLSGVQRFAVEITRALQALNPQYTLLTPPGGGTNWGGAREVGTHQGQIWEQLDLPRAATSNYLINLGNIAPVTIRKQLVVIHDTGVFSTPEAYSRRFCLWYKFLQAHLIRRGITIVTVSNFSRQEILHHLSASPDQVFVISEGADHIHSIISDSGVLVNHGLEPGRYVLTVGTPAAHKNMAALGNLSERLKDLGVPLVVAGRISSDAFGKAELPQTARYIGYVTDSELKCLYQNAACFVFPSRYEGFGLPPLEAMACGCPVVAADIPVLHEVCGRAVQYCDPTSPEDIAAQVSVVLTMPGRWQELREAGKARAATFTWAAAAREFDQIVSETANYA
jgi:glycosyltransferase involved in cell wall biosynthesis